MTNVFVTGGSGFVGGRLIERLRAEGHTVRALVRSPGAAARVTARGADPISGDLGDVAVMRAAAAGCAWAFHAAANTNDWGVREDFERDNVTGTRNVLQACAEAGVRRIVYVGTEAVLLAGQPLVNADESAPLRPDSSVHYCSTKARAEHLVLSASSDGFETVSIRPRWVWGAGDTVLLPRLIDRIRANRFYWIGGGKQRVSTTHVDNVVEALLLAVTRGASGAAYFVTDGDTVVFRDFVGELLSTQGVEPPTRNMPRPLAVAYAAVGELAWRWLPLRGRPPLSRFAVWYSSLPCTLNDARARKQLGYRPVTSREAGLTELRASA